MLHLAKIEQDSFGDFLSGSLSSIGTFPIQEKESPTRHRVGLFA
jgi:hypothetical protein